MSNNGAYFVRSLAPMLSVLYLNVCCIRQVCDIYLISFFVFTRRKVAQFDRYAGLLVYVTGIGASFLFIKQRYTLCLMGNIVECRAVIHIGIRYLCTALMSESCDVCAITDMPRVYQLFCTIHNLLMQTAFKFQM